MFGIDSIERVVATPRYSSQAHLIPGKPHKNGAHERMHLTLKMEIADPAAVNLKAQQRRTRNWIRSFNEERPHEALDMKTPAEMYVTSELKYHPPRAIEYGSEFEVREVNSKGDI